MAIRSVAIDLPKEDRDFTSSSLAAVKRLNRPSPAHAKAGWRLGSISDRASSPRFLAREKRRSARPAAEESAAEDHHRGHAASIAAADRPAVRSRRRSWAAVSSIRGASLSFGAIRFANEHLYIVVGYSS